MPVPLPAFRLENAGGALNVTVFKLIHIPLGTQPNVLLEFRVGCGINSRKIPEHRTASNPHAYGCHHPHFLTEYPIDEEPQK
jgi:hypothetical protein